jgi:hypothetical protein
MLQDSIDEALTEVVSLDDMLNQICVGRLANHGAGRQPTLLSRITIVATRLLGGPKQD